MATPFDPEQTPGESNFIGYSKDRIGAYKTYKRNMIQRNK